MKDNPLYLDVQHRHSEEHEYTYPHTGFYNEHSDQKTDTSNVYLQLSDRNADEHPYTCPNTVLHDWSTNRGRHDQTATMIAPNSKAENDPTYQEIDAR